MSTLTQRASVLGASAALAGSALFGGVAMTPLDTTGLFHSVQRDVALTGTILLPPVDNDGTGNLVPSFDQSMKFLMDAMLGIGGTTLPGLLDKDGTTTLESLLTPTGLSLGAGGSDMSDLFHALGLDNIQMSTVIELLGLQGSDTLGQALGTGGALEGLGGLTLNDLLGGLGGTSDATTIAGLVDTMGMGSTSIGELMGQLGFGAQATMGDLFLQLGIPGLEGFLPLMGSSVNQTVADFLGTLGLNAGTVTLHDLLSPAGASPASSWDGLLSSVGSMTLGQMLGFDSNTTLGHVITGLEFDKGGTATPLGDFTITELFGKIGLDPSGSLASVLGQLPLGVNAQDLGHTSLADFLGGMTGGTVDDHTTLTNFLTDAGMGTLTLDDWLGLGGVDISNWFTP